MERYEREITWWFKEFEFQDRMPEYIELFPELKSRLSKFAIGILQWEMKGFISLYNSKDIRFIRNILREIDKKGYFEKLDETFNDLKPLNLVKLLSNKLM